MSPHDVWDDWIEEHGDDLYPVVDTDVGRIGVSLAIEGAYSEYVRGLAVNGAEEVCPEPLVADEAWKIQNRARALDNWP